jgi:hypothetical protein
MIPNIHAKKKTILILRAIQSDRIVKESNKPGILEIPGLCRVATKPIRRVKKTVIQLFDRHTFLTLHLLLQHQVLVGAAN